ncbi:putative acrylyl-CoA reductase AcuI [Rosistilla oblonga]|uniref:YhdH/YhfP family quinone oxidoreductase n=1 Tax=Rosistilla oblonga TaxID=2527990 RepID=UPI00118D4CC7|nr:YhdH/YhfP family quinone oxidoreductase [Rosistilla oblonga]QDV14562.1 putative acrylyl-CoA reductase AcuI [Rosistilla oblonga]
MADTYRCFWVEKDAAGDVQQSIIDRSVADLPSVESPSVRVAVRWTSLNYKDALAATGHPGIVRHFPHVPGIDVIGEVIDSDDPQFATGQTVIVTGHELGTSRHGGWSQQIRVPASWIVPLPQGLTPREAIILGTAGFTAAQCVQSLQHHGVEPDSGKVVVTGASGGVASIAIQILSRLGYDVVAVSGKPDQHSRLKRWGAAEVIDRNDFIDESKRPLLSARYAGGVDTVGGPTLETLLRTTAYRGCIAACGLAGGHELQTTVYPFLLRGITLAGIDSAMCPMPQRLEIWNRLASDWKPAGLEDLANEISLDDLPAAVDSMLAGKHSGRSIVPM